MVITSKRNILSILFCLIICFWLVEAKSINTNSCYNSTRDFHPHLASRTPYGFVHGEIERVEGCTPLQIWMTARHGTRYPDTMTKKHMLDLENFRDRILTNHEYGRGTLCSKDLSNLRAWRRDPNFYEDKNGSLGEEGKKELHLLAKRLKGVFPEILESNDPMDYNFSATNQERAISSLLSFANSLIDTNTTVQYEDDKLKESQGCARWQKEYSHEQQMVEHVKFQNGPYMQQTLNEISQRLGFTKTVDYYMVNIVYDVCRYETALDSENKISVWCTVFSKEDLLVFEFLSDLDYYYCCGPGNVLSKKLNCGILQKLFKTFETLEAENVTNQPNGIFNFGHSTNIQSVMTLLKVFDHEEPLLASNYESLKTRLYNTTFMNAFSSNIVAVFYRCDNITTPNQVQFHIAENPIEIPGCDGYTCDWEYLKREFQPMLEKCDANFCDLTENEEYVSSSSAFSDLYVHHILSLMFVSVSYYLYS